MPYVNVKLYPGRSDEQKREAARRIAEALVEVCKVADASQVAVVFDEVSPADYARDVEPEIAAAAERQYHP
ncbi:MAG: tautomerase family protein [Armatimonadota bacterium]